MLTKELRKYQELNRKQQNQAYREMERLDPEGKFKKGDYSELYKKNSKLITGLNNLEIMDKIYQEAVDKKEFK